MKSTFLQLAPKFGLRLERGKDAIDFARQWLVSQSSLETPHGEVLIQAVDAKPLEPIGVARIDKMLSETGGERVSCRATSVRTSRLPKFFPPTTSGKSMASLNWTDDP